MKLLVLIMGCMVVCLTSPAQQIKDSLEKEIKKKEIDPILSGGKEKHLKNGWQPQWDKITKKLAKKFGSEHAYKAVLLAKIPWYADIKDYEKYGKCVLERVNQYGPYDTMFPDVESSRDWMLNSIAWELFQFCADTTTLLKALEFSAESIRLQKNSGGQYEDTYANMLYKLGRTKEAIDLEASIVERESGSQIVEFFRTALNKMKAGLPTWDVPKL